MSLGAFTGLSTFLVLAALFAFPVTSQASSQSATPAVTISVAEQPAGSDESVVEVVASDVSNLGAFQFLLSFDSSVLEFSEIQKGSFLAETGRPLVCNDPAIEQNAILFACVTLGSEPAGVDGTGTLATIHFRHVGDGTSALTLSRVRLSQIDGTAIAVSTANGSIRTGSDASALNWAQVLPVVAVVVVIVLTVAGLTVLRSRRRTPAVDT